MYLSSPRVNIAEESVEDHRVQLQCKFDEMEVKYTEAKQYKRNRKIQYISIYICLYLAEETRANCYRKVRE